ncbi:MAG: hypothetical protein GC137_02455 [Alphaproteobacteria bacterium]|nr:hypothetical protein [Alphaproteobacteria bacterium]
MRILIIIFMIFSFPAQAQVIATIEDMSVVCSKIEEAQANIPPADYVPGIDVEGKSVVPADITPSNRFVNDPIIIPIELNLAERFDVDLPDGVFSEPDLSSLEIYQNGKITYNGLDITEKVEEHCVKKPSKQSEGNPSPPEEPKQKNVKAAPQPAGQEKEIPVPSDDTIEGNYP